MHGKEFESFILVFYDLKGFSIDPKNQPNKHETKPKFLHFTRPADVPHP